MIKGKRAEARDILAPVYNRFTEGFDTRDLKEARAYARHAGVVRLERYGNARMTPWPNADLCGLRPYVSWSE